MTRIWVELANGLQVGGRKVEGHGHSFFEVSDRPMLTIQADRPVHMLIERGATTSRTSTNPPYRVPSMEEIRAIPWNGLTAISTFSGCGGSSLGYRMAGYRLAWANEFIDAARDSYNANKSPETILDSRDIRAIRPDDILSAIGIKAGKLDLMDGSPPCASFSTAGKREDGWGKVKAYSDKAQRTDDLFHEFARLLKGIQPKVFVAENVSGLIKGTAKGYFLEILAALKACGYRVDAKLLDAQWLGVPQARQRLIFVGVRKDLGLAPAFPKPLAYRYSVREALPWITRVEGGNKAPFDSKGKAYDLNRPSPAILGGDTLGLAPFQFAVEAETDISRYAIGSEWDKLKPGEASSRYFSLVKPDINDPSPAITTPAGGGYAAGVCHPTEKRKFSIAELRRICAFPDDFILTGSYAQQWERLGRAVPPLMMRAIATAIRDNILLPIRDKYVS